MDDISVYLDSIRQGYPDLIVKRFETHSVSGEFNDVLIINDDFIFRFPRQYDSVSTIKTEVQFLKYIKGFISLPIPEPLYTNLTNNSTSKAFMGYRKISGEPLLCETLAGIKDEQTLQWLADQLAKFLKELHSIPIENVAKELRVHDDPDEWAKMYADFQKDLFHFMRPDAQKKVSEHFASYLNEPSLHEHRICLRHGDFGAGNILYDPVTRTISGIIDFGRVGLGDPALDIAAVSCFGETSLTRFYKVYPEIDSMLERARFYKGTFALEEALYGFRNNDREAFESGIAEYV